MTIHVNVDLQRRLLKDNIITQDRITLFFLVRLSSYPSGNLLISPHCIRSEIDARRAIQLPCDTLVRTT